MAKPKVLITRPDIPHQAIDKIKEHCEVEVYDQENPIPEDELLKMIKGKDGLLCVLTDQINKQVINAAGSQLKVIATMSVGFEHIDLNECKAKNIQVSNTPEVSSASVAEWAVTLMLCAGRNFLKAATAVKEGQWKYSWSPMWLCGQGLEGSVVGIVGMGRIGQMIAKRLLPFGVEKILYFDICHPIKPAEEMGVEFAEFEDLLHRSDFVVAMVNLSEETEDLFDAAAFRLMKPTAIFVNTSRGGVVHQGDLYKALKEKVIRGAAIDVTDPEPIPKDHELVSLSNLSIGLSEFDSLFNFDDSTSNKTIAIILITPHVASAQTHVRIKMAELAAENVLLGLKEKKLKTPVPMPE